jgi:hypothetical protein
MQNNNLDLNKEVALVSFDCDMSSCTRVTNELDVNKDGKSVKKGTKVSVPVFPSDKSSHLRTSRERIRRYLQSVGVSFAGAFVVPKSELENVMKNTQVYVDDFTRDLQLLVANYDADLANFIDSYEVDELKSVIQNLAYSRDDFERRHFLEMLPPMTLGASNPEENDKLINKIGESVFADVASNAFSIYKKQLVVKDTAQLVDAATQTVVKALSGLRDKVEKLSFLNEGFGNLIKGFDTLLTSLPKSGKIENNHLTNVVNWIHTLRDKEMMKEVANGNRTLTLVEPDTNWFQSEQPTVSSSQSTTPPISAAPTANNQPESEDVFLQEGLFDDWG